MAGINKKGKVKTFLFFILFFFALFVHGTLSAQVEVPSPPEASTLPGTGGDGSSETQSNPPASEDPTRPGLDTPEPTEPVAPEAGSEEPVPDQASGFAENGINAAAEIEPSVARTPVSLKEAIAAALKGNRAYLDRVDAIRQRFGLGSVAAEQVLTVPTLEGQIAEVRFPAATSGLAGAETQFQTTISPVFSMSRTDAEGSQGTKAEAYGISLSKRFITGGNLSIGSSMSSRLLEDRTSSLQVGFSQPLLRGAWPFVVNEPVASARSDLRKEEIALECCDANSRQGLIFEVVSQYYGIKNQAELVEIARLAAERAERLFKATEAKMRVELATQLDVSRAELQLSSQERALNQAKQELGNREETFKVLLGMDTKSEIELSDPVVFDPNEQFNDGDLERFLEIAMANRPDIRVAEIRLEDARRKERIARRDLLPDLNSNFGYSVNNVGGLDPVSDPNQGSWSATLSLSYPLPLTSRKINIEQSELSVQREKRLFLDRKEEAAKQIKTDFRNVKRSREQLDIVQKEIESAERKLKIATFRFERGLASNFDVVDAENNLILAKQNRTKTAIDYIIAKSQLKRDMGVLTNAE